MKRRKYEKETGGYFFAGSRGIALRAFAAALTGWIATGSLAGKVSFSASSSRRS